MITGRRKDFGTGWHDGEYAIFIQGGSASNPPVITDSAGREHRGQYLNNEGGQVQFVFPSFTDTEPAKLTYNGQSQEIPGFGSEFSGPNMGSLQQRANKGPSASGAGGGSGASVGGMSSSISGGVAFPIDISSEFPDPVLTDYTPIEAAPYKYVDPIEFASKFSNFNRSELAKNMKMSKDFALDLIDTELQALEKYVPKSAGIKRFEIAADNVFNQQQRTQQLETAIPDQLADLNRIAGDYRTYASGEVPNPVVDRAMQLGTASAAADVAATSGFGVGSSAARKLTDLMSADQRIQLSQMGLQGLSDNAVTQANLRLAPTSYSDAGQQINVMPSVSGSQLQSAVNSDINNRTLLDPATGLSTEVNQNQFTTQLEQGTRQFNASNTLQNDQFNATNQNSFAMELFNYRAQLANAIQQATQGTLNIEREDMLREQNQEIFKDYFEQAQRAGDRGAVAAGIAQIVKGFGGIGAFINVLKDVFGSDIDTEDIAVDSDGDGVQEGGPNDFGGGGINTDQSDGQGGAAGDGEFVDSDGDGIQTGGPNDFESSGGSGGEYDGDEDGDGMMDSGPGGFREDDAGYAYSSGVYSNNPYDSASLKQFFISTR